MGSLSCRLLYPLLLPLLPVGTASLLLLLLPWASQHQRPGQHHQQLLQQLRTCVLAHIEGTSAHVEGT